MEVKQTIEETDDGMVYVCIEFNGFKLEITDSILQQQIAVTYPKKFGKYGKVTVNGVEFLGDVV